ncbi:SRPBCC domain-containing protein [Corynebacterium lubricantis]|uniref:SRPBCC domain-containing protein n=1 Tax=Corynebacterium lubricantis TaxID=541095 RepID=UPI000382DBF0|nr:SRPBCC domain-containing protein [Corynebacterium lubricantis]
MPQDKTGRIENGSLIIPVEFDYPQQAVWDFVTTSDTLVTFYGAFTGDPASGEVELAMVEAPDNPGKVTINRCEAPDLLDVHIYDPNGAPWSLILKFQPIDETRTRVEFIQDIVGFESMAADVGAGWEFYLERWKVAMAGGDVNEIVWEDYAPLAKQYEPEVPPVKS